MGGILAMFQDMFRTEIPARVVLVGLDNAGKSSILYKLKWNELVHTVPTIGFNVETLTVGNVEFTVWDIGGQDKIRPLWRHYFQNTDAIIFVVDSGDHERFDVARRELHRCLEDVELRNAKLLVLANKQDQDRATNAEELTEVLHLTEIPNPWLIQEASAVTGQGLYEGLFWLSERLGGTRIH
jgi:ADP-ribosylation factor protein 1